MKDLDIILRYLDKEIPPQELPSFERRLIEESELQENLEVVKNILSSLRNKLVITDIDIDKKNEELVAEIIASRDVKELEKSEEDKKEEAFRNSLQKIMQRDPKPIPAGNSTKSRKLGYISFMLAASISLILVILLPRKDSASLIEDFYSPANSYTTFLASTYRSENSRGVALFLNKNYRIAYTELQNELENSDSKNLLFCYAIASYEMHGEKEALLILSDLIASGSEPVGQLAEWYKALILLKAGRGAEARSILVKIKNEKGSFSKNARKLLRKRIE